MAGLTSIGGRYQQGVRQWFCFRHCPTACLTKTLRALLKVMCVDCLTFRNECTAVILLLLGRNVRQISDNWLPGI